MWLLPLGGDVPWQLLSPQVQRGPAKRGRLSGFDTEEGTLPKIACLRINGRQRLRTATSPSAAPNIMASHGISSRQLGDWNQNRMWVTTLDDFASSACSTNPARSSARRKTSKGFPVALSGSILKIIWQDGEAYIIPRLRENRLRIMQALGSGSSVLAFQVLAPNAL